MKPHSFAVRMLVEIRTDDKPEVLDFASLNQNFTYNELQEQEENLLEQLEFPEAEGLYHVFIFGHSDFVRSPNYEYGDEWDEEVYVDSSVVEIASEEEYTAMEVKWDCTLTRPQPIAHLLPLTMVAPPGAVEALATLAKTAVPIPNYHWPDQPGYIDLKGQTK